MKTVCVAVVVLSLLTVGQPAPLACEKLLKPVDKGPDISGHWYLIAMTSESCWYSLLLNIFGPSISFDITVKDTQNFYNGNVNMKLYGYCFNESETFLYKNNTVWDVENIDGKDVPSGAPNFLLQTDCPDCIVIKEGESDMKRSLMLWSRRKTVTEAELKEFETQAECLGWSKPQVFNTDHECLPKQIPVNHVDMAKTY